MNIWNLNELAVLNFIKSSFAIYEDHLDIRQSL